LAYGYKGMIFDPFCGYGQIAPLETTINGGKNRLRVKGKAFKPLAGAAN
jgi:hypothetical protein